MKTLFLPAGLLAGAGLLTLSSIAPKLFLAQLMWVLVGSALILFFRTIDTGAFLASRWFVWGVFGLSVLLLLAAYFTAPVIRGVRSWIVVGPLRFQPVELAKLGLIMLYASYFSRRHVAIARVRHLATSLLFFLIPGALTLLQPDLGSVVILFGIWFGFLLASGLPRKWIFISFAAFGIIAVLGWTYFLADYQKNRIAGVISPEQDTLGVNYSVSQSKIAIGSAGLWGKGYGQGTETQLGFLTEPATDFIFSAFAEEWGVVLGIVLVGVLVGLILSVLAIGMRARTNFERFFCIGTAITWGLHFIVNMGSALGLFPVVGVTLPFVSYGGSSLLVNFLFLAIVHVIDMRSRR